MIEGGVGIEYFDWSSLGHVPMPDPITVARVVEYCDWST